jgi:uncharacterized protein YggE
MKAIFLSLFLLTTSIASFSQADRNPYPRTITVSGSAEMEIVPDEIYVQVHLREYEKKGQGKVSIEKIRQDFLSNIRKLGIADSLISIANYDGYNGNPWWRKKNKREELYASIGYQLKLKNSRQVDEVVEVLDDNATQNFFIQRTTHSRIAEYRRALKIQAVKAAKEKAGYLADAINEKVGVAITIQEPSEMDFPHYPVMRTANAMMKESATADDAGGAPVDFKKMKLKFDATVVFALQ